MSEAQSVLNYALKMYGEALVAYAKDANPSTRDYLYFWQTQAWMDAKDVAKEQ